MGICKNCFKYSKETQTAPLTSKQTIQTYRSADILQTELTESKQFKISSKSCNLDHIQNFDAPTAKISQRSKSEEDKELIIKAFSHHFIFSYLPEDKVKNIINQMKCFSLEPGQIIFQQDCPGNTFFILSKGLVEIIVNDVRKGYITEGNGFGELALLNNTLRTATLRSVNKVVLWGLDRKIFRDALKTLSTMHFEVNQKFIKKFSFFSMLSESQQRELIQGAIVQVFNPGQKIVVEGDPGDLFYIIQEGVVQCSIGGKVVRTLSQGEYFGEMAIIYNTARSATIAALEKSRVLSFGKENLARVLGESYNLVLYKNSLRAAFEKDEYLKDLTSDQIEKIISKIEIFSYETDEIAIPEGTIKSSYIWVVLKGRLKSLTKKLESFDVIGAKAIYKRKNGSIKENFLADEETDIGLIKRQTIEIILGSDLYTQIELNSIILNLKKTTVFGVLSDKKLLSLAKNVQQVEYAENEEIFKHGDSGDCLYIVKEGQVDILKNNVFLRTLSKGSIFGERSIILNENRTASVTSKSKSLLWKLNKQTFLELVDEKMREKIIERINLQDDSIELSDLVVVDNIGKGSFGSVYLCCNKKNKILYALKSISRKKINFHNLHENLKQEKQVMQTIEHQFIIKLVKSFKDSKRIYFLLEYVQGITLYEAMQIQKPNAKFYSGILLVVLEYLHKNNVIYRDLKPENIMLDQDGYLKLLDFGTAKVIKDRTFTVIGTPQYIAPEVILGRGYSFSADLWSIGIIIYELICGKVPFGTGLEEEPFTIYREIVSGHIQFPPFIEDKSRERRLISKLLNKDPVNRGTAESVKAHSYFKELAWDDLLTRKTKAPYIHKKETNEKHIENCIHKGRSVDLVLNSCGEKDLPGSRKVPDKCFYTEWDRDF